MESIIFKPKDKKELELLKALGKKMRIEFSTLSPEDQEDIALTKLTLEGRTGKRVSRDEVMKVLKS